MCNNVAGEGGRKINYANGNVAGDFGRRRCDDNIGGDFGRKKCNDSIGGDFGRRRCDFVYECLEELLEEAFNDRDGRRRRCHDCDFVFECLEELLEDALGENGRRCRKDD